LLGAVSGGRDDHGDDREIHFLDIAVGNLDLVGSDHDDQVGHCVCTLPLPPCDRAEWCDSVVNEFRT
jgi:hypothetical protein